MYIGNIYSNSWVMFDQSKFVSKVFLGLRNSHICMKAGKKSDKREGAFGLGTAGNHSLKNQ